MADILKFRRPRNGTIKGAAHSMLTEAMRTVGKPHAVVIVVLSVDGNFAVRSVNYDTIHDFDMYARAASVIDREKVGLLDG